MSEKTNPLQPKTRSSLTAFTPSQTFTLQTGSIGSTPYAFNFTGLPTGDWNLTIHIMFSRNDSPGDFAGGVWYTVTSATAQIPLNYTSVLAYRHFAGHEAKPISFPVQMTNSSNTFTLTVLTGAGTNYNSAAINLIFTPVGSALVPVPLDVNVVNSDLPISISTLPVDVNVTTSPVPTSVINDFVSVNVLNNPLLVTQSANPLPISFDTSEPLSITGEVSIKPPIDD